MELAFTWGQRTIATIHGGLKTYRTLSLAAGDVKLKPSDLPGGLREASPPASVGTALRTPAGATVCFSFRRLCRQVLERDGWRCQSCGCLTQLQVHHMHKRSQLGADAEPNLITLCASCHHDVHR